MISDNASPTIFYKLSSVHKICKTSITANVMMKDIFVIFSSVTKSSFVLKIIKVPFD